MSEYENVGIICHPTFSELKHQLAKLDVYIDGGARD